MQSSSATNPMNSQTVYIDGHTRVKVMYREGDVESRQWKKKKGFLELEIFFVKNRPRLVKLWISRGRADRKRNKGGELGWSRSRGCCRARFTYNGGNGSVWIKTRKISSALSNLNLSTFIDWRIIYCSTSYCVIPVKKRPFPPPLQPSQKCKLAFKGQLLNGVSGQIFSTNSCVYVCVSVKGKFIKKVRGHQLRSVRKREEKKKHKLTAHCTLWNW